MAANMDDAGEAERARRRQAVSRTSAVGAAVNLGLSLLKIAAGVVGHSYALIVDGIHSLSDLLSDLLVWFAGRQASQAPDQAHPYGHARFETVATLVLGALLGTVALGIAWDAIGRLSPSETLLRPGPIALVAALASILTKEWLYWYTLGYAKRVRSEMLRANAWHHRSDAISSVVVLIGIAGTLVGLANLDIFAAVIVCLMIGKIAWDLIWEAIRELVDTGLQGERLAAIREIIESVGGVRDVHTLRTRKHGGNVTVDVHVLLIDPKVSVSEGHMISVAVEQRLKAEIDEINDVTVHIDPEDDERSPRCLGLPLRSDAVARLDELWSDIAAVAGRQRVILHYLNGRIDVELVLPAAVYGSDEEARDLCRRLSEALARDQDQVFRRVSVQFAGCALK
ncbi:cation diffusion facilitator family transporter [Thioflavicoccus mobilis 8321]|uniref:Cation diffusion facilitator family transporter n=1 Tax=Thioflavicoccus mobilis 8321 TaxID=765912 RepID=L0H411_9GAMM|nr:cation diffusion facilitator family transporter [Thioflavicoccus mobilis]AGA92339.1 cation diffusion facilitator family transporter [Thioflavicoccus mobilis 8321]